MMQMTTEQRTIHDRAMRVSKVYRQTEVDLVAVLVDVDRTKLFKNLNCPSLFVYTTQILGHSESVAYALISVARKTTAVPQLREALEQKLLSVSKASRIVSALNEKNAVDLIRFAQTHTTKEIDFEIVKLNPKVAKRDKARPIAEDKIELIVDISKAAYEKLKRLESLQAQKNQPTDWGKLLELALDTYLKKNDPVKKAERAIARKEKRSVVKHSEASIGPATHELCLNRVADKITENMVTISSEKGQPLRRIPLTAEQKNAVFARDKGRCTHVGLNYTRCNSDKWIDVHHVIPVSSGGSNDPKNLTTLCSFHHDLVHQLGLPIEGQVNWMRSPRAKYG